MCQPVSELLVESGDLHSVFLAAILTTVLLPTSLDAGAGGELDHCYWG